MTSDLDEFGEIARLFRPLAGGAPEALGLLDDAARIAPPPGEDLVITTDTIVEGVHFLAGTPPDLVARRLLRVNLSDLAAKAAEPWGWFLNIAWPEPYDAEARAAFARGLAEDQARFGLSLWGGDTVRTAGPLVATATMVGRASAGAMVTRGGARAGDVLLVSGTIGDAGLGLELLSARLPSPSSGEGAGMGVWAGGFEGSGEAPPSPDDDRWPPLVARHLLPEPRLSLRQALRAHATAAADVSDGLLADAGRIALASRLTALIDVDHIPLSGEARGWLALQASEREGRLRLATAGDDYEVVCTAAPASVATLQAAALAAGGTLTVIGVMAEGAGIEVRFGSERLAAERLGWTHGEGPA